MLHNFFEEIDYTGTTLSNLDELQNSNYTCLNDGAVMKLYFTGNDSDDTTSHVICPVCYCTEDE